MRILSNRSWLFIVTMFFGHVGLLYSQTEPIEGIRENTPRVHALVNAKIVQAPGRFIEKGTIILRDGIIDAVGADVPVPDDARIWDYDGMTIYPGLIEPFSQLGLPDEDSDDKAEDDGADHWNPHVHPEDHATSLYQPKESDLQKLRSLGFTSAVIVPNKGVFSGASALVSLRTGDINQQLLKEQVAQNIMFDTPGGGRRTYPNSLMGVIALIRQTFLDADWYQKAEQAYAVNPNQERPEANASLAALADAINKQQPVLFQVDNGLNSLRAIDLAKEFGLQTWVVGSGHEYRHLDRLKAAGVPYILPINFPEAPDVATPEDALDASLEELSHWDLAPANAKRLHDAGIPFAFTTATLKKAGDFYKKLRGAIEHGLSEQTALAAMTTVPANMIGVSKQLGSIDSGKLAHLVVTDGTLFDSKTTIFEVWVDGDHFEIEKRPEVDARGKWQMTLTFPDKTETAQLQIKGEGQKLNGTAQRDSTETTLTKVTLDHRRLSFSFDGAEWGFDGVLRFSGAVSKESISGHGVAPDGKAFTWLADSKEPLVSEEGDEDAEVAKKDGDEMQPLFPNGAYTFDKRPEQPKHVFVEDATIWTSGPKGKLENADMLITDGKIAKIGAGLQTPSGAVIIDGSDKHITPGLIDAHSHSGISQGVNEGSQAVTAEVSIGDVINNNDIAFYRELAGGLTAANQLHGSANPIGGQNSVIKLRWGASPEEMKIADAIPGIKFALGENVKQSNWGDDFTTRYPQTRMGVEQIIRDRFKAAQDYEREWRQYNSTKNKKGVIPPRRDLEMETLLEILRGKRLVHSHSYRQDEILMLLRIAEDFGFTIGTFQHVLEGYKIAEALAEHGAGASTFSDWWAYKFEVYDAIPYNGTLMHNVGVVVSFNSDSNELARRMNLEAAKAVKYGGLSEEEALKFVTLNPAKQLRIDHRVGSLEVGKDGDFVVWGGHPLSTYTICEQTWIEGRKYFDLKEDKKLQQKVLSERARLIQKVLTADRKDKPKDKAQEETKPTVTKLNSPEPK